MELLNTRVEMIRANSKEDIESHTTMVLMISAIWCYKMNDKTLSPYTMLLINRGLNGNQRRTNLSRCQQQLNANGIVYIRESIYKLMKRFCDFGKNAAKISTSIAH